MKTLSLALCLPAVASGAFLIKQAKYHPNYRQVAPSEKVKHVVDDTLGDMIYEGGTAGDVSKYVTKLGQEEASLGSYANKDLMGRLLTMREELCQEQGFQQKETSDCEKFMGVACSLEGAGSAQSVPAEKCHQFFMEEGASLDVDESSASEEAATQAVEEPAAEAPAEENATNSSGEGLFGAKKGRPVAEQGYNEYEGGKLVEHKDLHSHTEDWLAERDGRNYVAICKEFPNNLWCKMHTHQKPRPSSSSSSSYSSSPESDYVPEPASSEPVDEPEPSSDGRNKKPVWEDPEAHGIGKSGAQAMVCSASVVLAMLLVTAAGL
jgi:hypothetical protein